MLYFGIGGDHIEHVFWCSNDLPPLSPVKDVITLRGAKSLCKVSSDEVMVDVIATASAHEKNCNNLKLSFAVCFQEMNLGLSIES